MGHQQKRLDTVTSRNNRLEELRNRMPVLECSARVGCKYAIWYRWERGDSFPSLPYIPRIEALLSDVARKQISYKDIWPSIDPSIEDLG